MTSGNDCQNSRAHFMVNISLTYKAVPLINPSGRNKFLFKERHPVEWLKYER